MQQRGWPGQPQQSGAMAPWTQGDWAPAIDVKEDDQAYHLSADLPGLSREDIKLELEDGLLSLSAERKFEQSGEGENWRWVGRRYGSFSRRFRLPRTVDADAISAEYKDGVLHIMLPKSAEVQPKTVSIN
jgi:HSP20 family protein